MTQGVYYDQYQTCKNYEALAICIQTLWAFTSLWNMSPPLIPSIKLSNRIRTCQMLAIQANRANRDFFFKKCMLFDWKELDFPARQFNF